MPTSQYDIDKLTGMIIERLVGSGSVPGGATSHLERLLSKLSVTPVVFGGGWDRVRLGRNISLVNTLFNVASGRIAIGDHSFFGHNVSLLTGTHDVSDTMAARQEYPKEGRDIVIGDGVWIASNATVLGPCTIEANAVIAAGSVVAPHTIVPAGCVYAGVPARRSRASVRGGDDRPEVQLRGDADRSSTPYHVGIGTDVVVRLPDVPDFVMRLHPRDDPWISDWIRQNGVYEPIESSIFTRLLGDSRDVYDVGANIGWYSLLAACKLGERGQVHAFEPSAKNVALLSYNVAANALANVAVHPFAIGRETGIGDLYFCDVNPGDHRAFPSIDEPRSHSPVAIRRLDQFFNSDRTCPALVKVDTQGFELDVLRGMGDLLMDASRDLLMLIEFWPRGLDLRGADIEEMCALLEEAALRPAIITEFEPGIRRTSYTALALAAKNALLPSTNGFVNLLLYRGAEPPPTVRDLFVDSACSVVPDV